MIGPHCCPPSPLNTDMSHPAASHPMQSKSTPASAALGVACAQLNLIVGDVAGNADKIEAAARQAHAAGAHLLLTPELSISSYAAEDLFLRPSFIAACDAAVRDLALRLADLPGLSVVVGHPVYGVADTVENTPDAANFGKSVSAAKCYNAATVLCEGKVVCTYYKCALPNYQIFDERRYFAAGQKSTVFAAGPGGCKIGLLVCEDAWFDGPALAAKAAGAQVLAVINASPYHFGKRAERYARMGQLARSTGLPLVYAHMAGGQDECVYDGASFAVDATGQVQASADSFVEALLQLQIEPTGAVTGSLHPAHFPLPDDEADLWRALVTGVRDYVQKNGFPGVLLGLSGGIDSALVLAIAVDALGPKRVRAVMMPSPYTASISTEDAAEMARRLGVRYDEISILPEFEAYRTSLTPLFEGKAEDSTEENLQARIRGMMLMALSNKHGDLVLTTGNKSEMAVGYATLYGDMAGGFAVIKDVLKTTVFKLARWRNVYDPYGQGANPIPERIITRPPSAELRPDQKDQDSLPPYDILDAIIARYVENNESAAEIVAAGYAQETVEKVVRLIRINEYKRRQAAVGIRVTHRSFGKDWRYPITNRFRG